MADAPGGTIKTLDSLCGARHWSLQVDYQSDGTLGMPSFISQAGGDGHERLN